jgi:hypothetical protein
MYFKLDENKKVVKSSLEEWSNFIEGRLPTNHRHVGDDIIDGKRISTVFIGLCYDFGLSGMPRVFETMVFEGDKSLDYQERYFTWEDAEDGHLRAIEWVKNGCKDYENTIA